MTDCIFCKIVAGEIPATRVFENEHALAFLDINPTNPGHTLVVPKAHAENIDDIPDETICALAPVVKKVAGAVKKAVKADGINLIQNNGRAAGQIVPHFHIHVVPRFDGDGFRHWKGVPYKTGEAEQVAEKIKAVLGKDQK